VSGGGSGPGQPSRTVDLLRPVCSEIEGQLRPHLNGFFGGMIRSYLPQVWVFRTDQGECGIRVDPNGHASVLEIPPATSDVVVEWTDRQLNAALATRDKHQVPPGPPPQIQFRSEKGKTAFSFLRTRIGL
jgi:hypothetical protein